MFIIVIGTRAAGKSAVKKYLLQEKGFTHVRLVLSNKSKEGNSLKNKDEMSEAEGYPESSSRDQRDAHDRRPEVIERPDSALSYISTTSSAAPHLNDSDPDTATEIDGSIGFTDPARLLDHITRNWRENFVTEDITTRAVLEPFLKRPFVLLLSVDAPTLMRFSRYQKYTQTPAPPSKFSFFNNRSLSPSRRLIPNLSLEQFIAEDDSVNFGPNSDYVTSAYLFASHHLCHINIINSFESVQDLRAHLDDLDLLNPDRLRPCWDSYFMKLASLASHRSNCMKRRVGAILVRDHAIIATGYNGTPRGVPNCNEGGCRRCNEGDTGASDGYDECLCIHAEENALLEAGRERVGKGAIIYCNTCPCLKCTIKIVQNGVTEVVYNLSYKMDASSARVFELAGVKLRQYSPPR